MKIYFMGICGTAMGNAALLARAAGHAVSGADSGVYPPMSTVLQEAGIELHEGYDPERLQSLAPDLVVIGNAMSRGNPELEWLLDTRAIRFTSLPALLAEFVLQGRRNIVVCGTHGKTTTTSLAAFILQENQHDAGYLIGGVPLDPPKGNHLGSPGEPFVIEGDEYDSAFFDKRSKFIHYAPHVAVLNNLEFDHADIFRDLQDVQRTFSHLTRIVPRNGWIVTNGDDANLRALGPCTWTRIVKVGTGTENDVRIEDFKETANGSSFSLRFRGAIWQKVQWKVPGQYNARNAAMAAVAALLSLQGPLPGIEQVDTDLIDLACLSRFRGVRRRQEVLLQTAQLLVIEDFGHHPTALAETIRSFRNRYPTHKIKAVFEPRSNTARTRVLQSAFADALTEADEVYIGAVNRSDKLKAEERFDVDAVATYAAGKGRVAVTAPDNAGVLQKLLDAPAATMPELVIFFTNGSFDGIIGKFVAAKR